MKIFADTQGFYVTCQCGESTGYHTQVGAAREAYKEHHQLEHGPSTQGGFSHTPKETEQETS